jgi:hypothetical protein
MPKCLLDHYGRKVFLSGEKEKATQAVKNHSPHRLGKRSTDYLRTPPQKRRGKINGVAGLA